MKVIYKKSILEQIDEIFYRALEDGKQVQEIQLDILEFNQFAEETDNDNICSPVKIMGINITIIKPSLPPAAPPAPAAPAAPATSFLKWLFDIPYTPGSDIAVFRSVYENTDSPVPTEKSCKSDWIHFAQNHNVSETTFNNIWNLYEKQTTGR